MKNWEHIEDAFLQLNAKCEYLILRNFEGFFDDILIEGHNDIDVLCASRSDRKNMVHILDAVPRIGVDNGIHYKFLYKGKEIALGQYRIMQNMRKYDILFSWISK